MKSLKAIIMLIITIIWFGIVERNSFCDSMASIFLEQYARTRDDFEHLNERFKKVRDNMLVPQRIEWNEKIVPLLQKLVTKGVNAQELKCLFEHGDKIKKAIKEVEEVKKDADDIRWYYASMKDTYKYDDPKYLSILHNSEGIMEMNIADYEVIIKRLKTCLKELEEILLGEEEERKERQF